MAGGFFLIAAVILTGVIVKEMKTRNNAKIRSSRRFRSSKNQIVEMAIDKPIPTELVHTLGLKIGEGEPLAEKLENAWRPELESAVKARLIDKRIMSDQSFPWYQLELKRFFFLSALLKNVPMYSEKVDAIWHDMILFTKDYAAFCEEFNGEMIHHTPTNKSTKTEDASEQERAVFELVYSVSFTHHPYTETIQGSFGHSLLQKSFIQEWQAETGKKREAYIQREWFGNTAPEHSALIRTLTKKIAALFEEAEEQAGRKRRSRSNVIQTNNPEDQIPVWLLSSSIIAVHKPVPTKAADGGVSSCGGHYDRDDRYDHHDSDHDSSSHSCSSDSGGGSSCSSSSCGSGCGSS